MNKYKPGWDKLLNNDYIRSVLNEIYSQDVIVFPSRENVFKAFNYFEPEQTNVVILGQDPYHNGQATGLCFQVKLPPKNPSLKNIEKLLGKEIDFESWANQGILLLNKTLTVEYAKPNSHKDIWDGFIDEVIDLLPKDTIYVLWGKEAQTIDDRVTMSVKAGHPSPLNTTGSFFEVDSFKEINILLKSLGKKEIEF